jgi:uncharacterized protein YcbX
VRVAELWRYPVKSLRGEQLDVAEVGPLGVAGDRLVQALRPGGRVFTGRTHRGMLALQGALGADGRPTIDGLPWDSPDALAAVRSVTSADAELVWYDGDGPQRFDILPLSVATDGGVAAVGVDRRRFRPNILIEGVEGLDERAWVGHALRLGQAVIGAFKPRERCVMTTYDPDTLEQNVEVLRKIVRELDGCTSLDCFVLEPGRVSVGDEVELLGRWTLPRPA